MKEFEQFNTIRDFARWLTTEFNKAKLYFGHGTSNAWDEAITLIFYVLHLPHEVYNTVLDAKINRDEKSAIYELAQARIQKRLPLPYLIHEAWFAGLKFFIDERVLIPRSSFAECIAEQFEPWVNPEEVAHILDLCTGSGCIAIALAKHFPFSEVDASDISNDALAVAKINIKNHGLEDQINLISSDLFEAIPEKKYDLIVSNPPYVDAEDMGSLPSEYEHEPALALASGQDGLDAVKSIMKNAARYLSEHGLLFVEVGNSEKALLEQFPNLSFTWVESKNGDCGIFFLTRQQLLEARF